ncbi:hypothetical protein GGR52DRAFT_564759, partial [Hypoxylon sp. FL1284]
SADLYKSMLDAGKHEQIKDVPSPEELTYLCKTLHGMNRLVQAYVTAHRQAYYRQQDSLLGTAPLSTTERLRLLRAFYRRQIICNALVPTERLPAEFVSSFERKVGCISNPRENDGIPPGVAGSFEPWELQQIVHVERFIQRLCGALHREAGRGGIQLCDSRWDSDPKLRQIYGKRDFAKTFSHTDEVAGYLRNHSILTDAALRAVFGTVPSDPDSHDLDQEPAGKQYLRYCRLFCLEYRWQACRFRWFPDLVRDWNALPQQEEESEDEAPNEYTELEEYRPPFGRVDGPGAKTIEFAGDSVDLPPFAWVDGLDGRYVNWFGDALDLPRSKASTYSFNTLDSPPKLKEDMMLWTDAGFTLWDRRRVEAFKELGQMRQFRTGWIIE